MRSFALVHDGVITRVVQSDQNPFHASMRAVEVTGIPAQIGNTVDAVGNVGPSIAMSPADAALRRPAMLAGEAAYRMSLGVWVGDKAFDIGHGALSKLAALADAKSPLSMTAEGELVKTPAAKVYAAAGKYLSDVMTNQAKLAEDPNADMSQGWPDNGEPDEKPAPATPVAMAAPDAPVGTGIIPEQTPEAPHADPNLNVGGVVTAPVIQP